MLEIRPCVDKQVILPYCQACHTPYSEALYLYQALDRQQELAAALFQIDSNLVTVLYYRGRDCSDFHLFDAVLRAGLNYADRFGIGLGHIPDTFRQRHTAFFQQLNYPPEYTFNITNFFQKYKNCRSGESV